MNHGDLFRAARNAGLSIDFLTKWMRDDPKAAEEITEAQRVGYMGLESVLIDRAVHGVEKGVYYKGEVVGYETQYSDSLLIKALEARVPAYKKGEAGAGGVQVNVQVNNMPRAETYDEWLNMKQRTLEDRASEAKALPAPGPRVPEVLTGDYVVKDTRPLNGLEGLGI